MIGKIANAYLPILKNITDDKFHFRAYNIIQKGVEHMSAPVIIWIVAIAAFLVLEAATVSLVSLWFVGGAFCAMLAAIFGASFLWQFAIFVVISGALLALVRPLIKKYVSPRSTRTNADRLIGRQALVTEDIDNLTATGAIRIDGVLWTARSATEEKISKDTRVVITCIEGAKVYVKPADVPANV